MPQDLDEKGPREPCNVGEDGFSMWNLREEKCSQMDFPLEEAWGRGAGSLLADALSPGLPRLWSEVEALTLPCHDQNPLGGRYGALVPGAL